MPDPTDLPGPGPALRALVADPARHPVLLALDFDGTLAPLRDDPQTSRILPDAVRALRELADHPGVVRLALVSGRSLADLHRLAEVPPGTVLIGSHGAERARVTAHGLDADVITLTEEQSDRLARLADALQAIAGGRDGVWVETKPAAVVVHTRLAEPATGQAAEREALTAVQPLASVVLHGKNVVEASVLDAEKGMALTALRDELSARAVVFAGDDVTDEDAFRALGDDDVTIKVGPGATVGRYRAADPGRLATLLAELADLVDLTDLVDPIDSTSGGPEPARGARSGG